MNNITDKKKKYLLAALVAMPVMIGLMAFDSRLNLVNYYLKSDKLNEKIKIALVADLHSCDYGENQHEIFDLMDKENPDIVLLAGDIIDDKMPEEKAIEFLKILGQKYPSYYVSGNHECWTHSINRLKNIVRENNITVLEGDTKKVKIKNQVLDISGIDDPSIGKKIWEEQLRKCNSEREGNFSILVTHRPEKIEEYAKYNYDLAVAGHAHGGQWRIPFIINGLYAPNQGFLPRYAGGEYTVKNTKLIVSRGLARESTKYIPRIFNRPELVIININ